MCCVWIVFSYLWATVSADNEGNLTAPLVACNSTSDQSLKHCGDDFFDANLCLKCGCCVTRQDEGSSDDMRLDEGPSDVYSTYCYVPPGSENIFELSPSCKRSLKSLLGQVLLVNDGPSPPRSPVTFYALLERYSPRLQMSLEAFGSSSNVPELLPFSRDAKDLPTSVKKQLRDLTSGAEPFFFSYATVTYPLPDVYNGVLVIESQDRLDSLSVESKVSVRRMTKDIPLTSSVLRTAVLVNQGPYKVGEESMLAVVSDDIDPDIELTLDFGDNSEIVRRGSLSFLLDAYSGKPGYACLFAHRYSSGGEYLAKAILFTPNDESGITEVRLTTTVRIRCAFPRLEATGGTIARSAAVQKKRNEALIFHVLVIQDCSDQPVVTQWSLFLVDQDETVPEQEQMILVDTDRNQMSELEVKIQPYTLVYGLYVLNVTVTIPYHNPQNQLIITEAVWFEVVTSTPVAIIDGPLLAGDWETVTFSASKSYDPDVNRLASPSLLSCTWYCLTGQWNWTTVQQQAQTSFKDVEGCYYPGCMCENLPDKSAHNSFLMTWPHDDYYRQTIPAIYSVALRLHTFKNRAAYAVQSLMFYPDKSDATSTSQTTIPIELVDKIPDVDIACLSNCLQHVDHTKPLVLYAYCRNCILHEVLTYEWDFQSANESFMLKSIDWARDTLTGNQKASVIVNAKTFENITEEESYQFFVTVTRLSGKHAKAGFSFYFARYNIDYSMGASRDSGATAMERRLHIFLIALSVLKFEWM